MGLQLADVNTEILIAHPQRLDDFEAWKTPFLEYFDIAELTTQTASDGRLVRRAVFNYETPAITIFLLRLRSPKPSEDEITDLLEADCEDENESVDDLLARVQGLQANL